MAIQLLEGNKAKPREQQAQTRYHEKRREDGSKPLRSIDFCTRNATSLEPVHTYPDIFEKGIFFSVFVLPSTRKRRLQAAKTQVFKTTPERRFPKTPASRGLLEEGRMKTENRMMSYINTLHISSVRCGFLSSGENDSNTLKTAEEKNLRFEKFPEACEQGLRLQRKGDFLHLH